MTTEAPVRSQLVPVPPDWLLAKQEARPVNVDRNLNDCYWQKPFHNPPRPGDGFIVTGPSSVKSVGGRYITTDAENWERRGYRPLTEYSYTNRISPKTQQRETIETNEDRLYTKDRWYWLFVNMAQKGLPNPFTIEEIVERHWHLEPPYGLSVEAFPQLEEWQLPEAHWCPNCPGSAPPKNSPEEVVTHLMVQHQQTLMMCRELQASTDSFRLAPSAFGGLNLRRKIRTELGFEAPQEVELRADVGVTNQPAPRPAFMPVSEHTQVDPRLPICMACGELIEGPMAAHSCAAAMAHDSRAADPGDLNDQLEDTNPGDLHWEPGSPEALAAYAAAAAASQATDDPHDVTKGPATPAASTAPKQKTPRSRPSRSKAAQAAREAGQADSAPRPE